MHHLEFFLEQYISRARRLHVSRLSSSWLIANGRVWHALWLTVTLCACVRGQTEAQSNKPVESFLYAPATTKSSDIWHARASERIAGELEELDDVRIAFLDTEGKHRELPSNRVIQVEPVWRTSLAADAHKLFCQRKYREAKQAITAAATNDLPRWQQRFLVAEIVDVLSALGDNRIAGGVFLASLAPHHPPAMLYAHLPMNWTTADPDRHLYEAAAEWVESEEEAAQLLGASWLLLGPDRDIARSKLLKLQNSKTEPIALLATAQTWRLVSPLDTHAKLAEWLEFRDRLLPPLQVGPTEFLADRLGRAGLLDLAIGQWSRVAAVHGDRSARAFAALTSAARALEQQGRTQEAQRFHAWAEQFGAN